MFESDSRLPIVATVASMAIVPAVLLFLARRNSKSEKAATWKDQLSSTFKKDEVPSSGIVKPSTPSNDPSDAWEERRRRGIMAASSHERKDHAGTRKPFGSSYYYAHNNSYNTGGYKDGLTMEDYTMNGPRLLSRGGLPVTSISNTAASSTTTTWDTTTDAEDICSAEKAPPERQSSALVDGKRVLKVSKYLWDDPGDSKGVATILIDQLPGRTSSESIHWRDVRADVIKIDANLKDQGLDVVVETSKVNYYLKISLLYGKVDTVKAVSKEKRLLIRLTKSGGILNKSNLKAWPYPQKRIV
jgi:hypothetical protein